MVRTLLLMIPVIVVVPLVTGSDLEGPTRPSLSEAQLIALSN